MNNLTEENLQTSFDGLWIKTQRQKTGVESNIRLLEVPGHIIKNTAAWRRTGNCCSCRATQTARTA